MELSKITRAVKSGEDVLDLKLDQDRCDFSILLRDEWRHKALVRDVASERGGQKSETLRINGKLFDRLRKKILLPNNVNHAAMVAAAIHWTLSAYGQGGATIIGVATSDDRTESCSGKIVPALFSQKDSLTRPCRAIVEEFHSVISDSANGVSAEEWIGKGIFDLVVFDGECTEYTQSLPLAITVADSHSGLTIRWHYSSELFDDRVIRGLLDIVREIIQQLCDMPDIPLEELELVSDAQIEQFDRWNATDGDFPSIRLEALFESAVRRTPDKLAIICNNTRLTFQQLEHLANQASNCFIPEPEATKKNGTVALCLDKSYLTVTMILALWKAGASFVAVDPAYPKERISFIIRDVDAVRIITNRRHADALKAIKETENLSAEIFVIEDLFESFSLSTETSDCESEESLNKSATAYITYTSGTTGTPKGVAKAHEMVVNSITDISSRYEMTANDEERVALFSSFVFEPFLRQMLIALINSQTLVIVPDELRFDPVGFPEFVNRNRITYLNGTLSVLQQFDLMDSASLKRIILVGEELTSAGLRKLREKYSGQVINEYAFTETAFVTAVKAFDAGIAERPNRSIGKPLRNVKCYVLDRNLKRLPIGAVGILYIGGSGVADGYLNRKGLTGKSFFKNPFQTEVEKKRGTNGRIYATGDLARFLPNGEIEFLGRSDFQVKLNGIRVEPGEIESKILDYENIAQCIVVPARGAGADGTWRLVAYIVSEDGITIDETSLIEYLKTRLISVMVPARVIQLSHFSLNINGKIDRAVLPKAFPEKSSESPGRKVTKLTHDDLEISILDIWSRLLSIPVANIDLDDDFFKLGGQSVTCIQLLAGIWKELRIHITIDKLYQLRTIRSLSAHIKTKRHQNAPVDQIYVENPYRLRANGLQQGLMYQALRNENSDGTYIMQTFCNYKCEIDQRLLKNAWLVAKRKYPSLRLRFEWDVEPVQIIEPDNGKLNWQYFDWSSAEGSAVASRKVRELQEADRRKNYDLSEGDLIRLYLVRLGDTSYSLLLSCHHIILDGWSVRALFGDVHKIYADLLAGKKIGDQLDTTYVEAQLYISNNRHQNVDYWVGIVNGIDELGDYSGLLSEASRYGIKLHSYSDVEKSTAKKIHIGEEIIERIRNKCMAHRVSLHSVLQFVWHRVLYAIGGSTTTAVGTVVSGRNIPVDGIDDSVGLFINTLPLVVEHSAQPTVLEALVDIQKLVNKMNSCSTVELGALHTDGMKRRLFDTLLVLENYPTNEDLADNSDQFRINCEIVDEYDQVDYPLAVVARDHKGGLDVNLWYASEIFAEEAIDTLLETLKTLFEQIPDKLDESVSSLEVVSRKTKSILDHWNSTDRSFPSDLTLSQIFESVARRWPNETAIVYRDRALTYDQLNRRANQFSDFLLRNFELGADAKVALFMDKSEWLFVAILGVWKAGAAYVPIDTNYPSDRIQFMLDDTAAELIVLDSEYVERIVQISDRAAVDIRNLSLGTFNDSNNSIETESANLAYAIYTSGTTGKPKAVLVEHRGVVNLHASLKDLFNLDRECGKESILSFSNYVFDHFVEQMTDALLSGQKLVVLDDAMRSDHESLYQYMIDNEVTYLSGTPSVLSLYEYSGIPSLKRIDAIGEDFTTPVFEKIRATFSGVIINGYGPTEISITSHKRPYSIDENRTNKSIGLPIANTKSYVLDSSMMLVPIGGIGELYIGGVGVARGYLNRDDLTQERFIENPFQSQHEKDANSNSRLYRTGDLVRWLPNGELEYLGRNDMQVKIRGLRVELGEIEAALSSFAEITRSFVIARDYEVDRESASSQKYLVGFYLSETEIADEVIREHLRSILPDALVPAHLIRLEKVPVTQSGKLDVRELPDTKWDAGTEVQKVMPRSDIEKEIQSIWADVLDLSGSNIGIYDEFFRIGGDSLRAIKLVHLIKKRFNVSLSIQAVFENTTTKSQAKVIINRVSGALEEDEFLLPGTSGKELERTGISIAQERILFIDQFLGGNSAYNIPFAIKLKVKRFESINELKEALLSLILRHKVLRTQINTHKNGKAEQVVLSAEDLGKRFSISFTRVSSSMELDQLLVSEAYWVFDLNSEIPLRVHIIELGETLYVSLVFHHIAFDGWSWSLFQNELSLLMSGKDPKSLAPIRFEYTDFASWQRQRLAGERLEVLQSYWMRKLQGFCPLDLPLDKVRPAVFDYSGKEITFDLDADCIHRLKAIAADLDISFYSLMLGSYSLLLHAYTGQNDLVIGAPSANRWESQFDNTVGFFTNLLVLRTEISSSQTLSAFFRDVGETVRAAQVHQELPFEYIVRSLEAERDTSRHPVVQSIFSYINENVGATYDHDFFEPYIPNNDGYTSAKFDLSMTIEESCNGVKGNLTYADSLFEEPTILEIVNTFQTIVQEIAELANRLNTSSISDVSFVEESERKPVSSDAESMRPREVATPISQFEYYATEFADDDALVFGQKRYTYRELNKRANQLAHHISNNTSIKFEDVIGLMIRKSDWTIISILAAWKLGAGYVPIDPDSPPERNAFMLRKSEAKLLLVDASSESVLSGYDHKYNCPSLCVDRADLSDSASVNPGRGPEGDGLCYVIFTSGTTGKPKPVFVSNENVACFVSCIRSLYFNGASKSGQSILFLANYVFDFSVEQIGLSILSGNRLVVPQTEELYTSAFYDYANQCELSYLSGTPSQIFQFDLTRLPHLQFVVVAGESFQPSHYEKIRAEYSGLIFNAYGTTETTVYNSVRQFDKDDEFANDIGTSLLNSEFFIVNASLNLLPEGARGELYISGKCVSKGYLKDQKLSSLYFIPNPFQTPEQKEGGANEFIYKTGDLVRRRPSGALEFLGRNDSQVKINGIRIEPAEVESVIMEYPGITHCHVLVRGTKNEERRKRLCAYYVTDAEKEIIESDLIRFLQGRLTNSMIPGAFVKIDKGLPVTVNGKIDTSALKRIEDQRIERGARGFAEPKTLTEYQLKRAWAQALNVTNIAVDDNFFQLGGDSIVALRLASRIRRIFNKNISVKNIFDYPTIASFSENVLELLETDVEKKSPPELDGVCPMLPIQRWFFEKKLDQPAHWNQYFAIKTPALDLDRLETALSKLVDRHDVFRLRYKLDHGVEQFYSEKANSIEVREFDVRKYSNNELERKLEGIQSNYDLERGPLYSAAYLHGFADGSARIWMSLHHLIVDTVSWYNITQDLEVLYHGIELGRICTSYKDWVESLFNYRPVEQEIHYWREAAEGVRGQSESLNQSTGDSCSWQFVVSEAETRRLMNAGIHSDDSQVVDSLLCALANALPSLTGQSTNYVVIEGHGREEFEGAAEVKDSVGWFTSMFPFKLSASSDIPSSIRTIREDRSSIPYNGIGYGAIFGVYGGDSAPLPRISFNYLGRYKETSTEPSYQSESQSTSWELDTERSGISKGTNDSGSSDCVIDITVKCVGTSLVVELESLVGTQVTERFFMAFKSSIDKVAAQMTRKSALAAMPRSDLESFEPYIIVNEDVVENTLFVLPPGEGGAESYLRNIARELEDIRLVLFNNIQLYKPMDSFAEIAQFYLEFIRRIQPVGAYSFLGWSFGGVLSFEIAKQLALSGEFIDQLIMIDSFFNVKRASDAIGLADQEDILDPINFRYQPSVKDLNLLIEKTAKITLFKATEASQLDISEEQQKLFAYFADSTFNNLDTFIDAKHFDIEEMNGKTHFSWIQDGNLVADLAERIRNLSMADVDSISPPSLDGTTNR